MNVKWLATAGLTTGVVLLLAVNILGNTAFTAARLDLTENKLYTLSEGTKNVLSALEEPVTLRLFLSQELATHLPSVNSYTKRVRELLQEYERAAHGKLVVTAIDPEPFSEEEDRAVGYGLHGIPLGEESTFYFGVVATSTTDEEQVIPYLTTEREEFLEYDLTRLIYQVANPKQKVIGLISSLAMDGISPQTPLAGRPQPWMVLEHIRQFFDVRTLEPNVVPIPEDVDVLMLVHPKNLSDKTLYAIDQFVVAGGRALIFVDPHSELDRVTPAGLAGMDQAQTGSDMTKLLDAWGLELVPSKVVGDLQLATRVRLQREGRIVAMNYPVWVTLPPSLFNQDDAVTATLGHLAFASVGRLKRKDERATRITPLIESTVNAMQIDTSRLDFSRDPQDLLRNYQPDGERFTLAARITGEVESAFPDGPPDGASGKKESFKDQKKDKSKGKKAAEHDHLGKSKSDINIIVVADTDMLRDQFWVQVQDFLGTRLEIPTAANGTFVVNALDNLTGSNALISIRSRGRFTRPFTRVNALRQEAELRFREKEQRLISRLQETEDRLLELERRKQDHNAVILSEAQQQEIARFRQEKIQIRKGLRNLRHELRKDIESLEGWMKFINIGMMPVLIGIGGLVVGSYQIRRRKKGVRTTANTG